MVRYGSYKYMSGSDKSSGTLLIRINKTAQNIPYFVWIWRMVVFPSESEDLLRFFTETCGMELDKLK
jgi:hypothetical protein